MGVGNYPQKTFARSAKGKCQEEHTAIKEAPGPCFVCVIRDTSHITGLAISSYNY